MAFETAVLNSAVSGATGDLVDMSLHTADPGGTGASEVSGGSYARQSSAWGSASAGSQSRSETFDVPASTTVSYVGFWDSSTWQGGFAVDTAETWSNAGTADVTATVTAS
ncbi:MAG: phage tail fiber protein [Streptosporangiales bacterium]